MQNLNLKTFFLNEKFINTPKRILYLLSDNLSATASGFHTTAAAWVGTASAAWVGIASAACITAAAVGCNLLKTGGVDVDGVGLGGEGATGDEADNDALYASFFGRFACVALYHGKEGSEPFEAYTVALFHPLEYAVLYAGPDHLNLFGS